MTKVEAPTLEEAYKKASLALECSISELQCEVVQHPRKGILGFLKKNAIIVATSKNSKTKGNTAETVSQKKTKYVHSTEVSVADEIIATVKEEVSPQKTIVETKLEKNDIVDGFFETNAKVHEDKDAPVVYDELAYMIESELKELLSHSCFAIDVVEVDVNDNTALIFIDGDDAALLIGKEGYRYNALSYMLFNWLHTKYELFIKLEIAEFLTTQQAMIKSYIQPVIETAEKTGRAKTQFLDGILVQIALEQLREHFPNKYVAVKTSRDGKKFVVINEFNNKTNG